MRYKCKVPNCSNTSSRSSRRNGITFYPFPTDKIILKAWLKSLRLKLYDPLEDNVICSEHFNERDIFFTKDGLRKIHHNAVPVCLEPEALISSKVCRICFVMDDKMKMFNKYHKLFEDVTGILLDDEDSRLPQHICWECAARLTAAANFRAKAFLTDGILHDLLSRESDLKFSHLKPIKRVISKHGFESKLKQVTFDVEHFDINIRDTFVDTNNVNKLKHDYVDNDLHEIIDENEGDDETEFTNNKTYVNDETEFTNNETYDDETEFTNNEAYDNDETEFTNKEIYVNYENEIITILNEDTDFNGYETSNIDTKIETKYTEIGKKIYYETFDTDNEINDSKIIIDSTEADIPEVNDFTMELEFENNDSNNEFLINDNEKVYKKVKRKRFVVKRNSPALKQLEFENNDSNNEFLINNDNEEVHKKVKRKRFVVKRTGPALKQLEFENNDSNNEFLINDNGEVLMKVKRKRFVINRNGPALKQLEIENNDSNNEFLSQYMDKELDNDKPKVIRHLRKDGVAVFNIGNVAKEIPEILLPLKPYFTITPITQEQQLKEIQERKEKDGYLTAPYKCKVCYQGYLHKDKYDAHMIRHDKKNGSFLCGICLIFKKDAKVLHKHMRMHTYEFACKQCSLVTRHHPVARAHVKFHEGDISTCPYCSETFEIKSSYQNHIRCKHKSDIVCELCGYNFVTDLGLKLHKTRAHQQMIDNPPPFEGPHCDKCDVTFLSQEAYDTHLRCSSKHLDGETDPIRVPNRYQSNIAPRKLTCELCGLECGIAAYRRHLERYHPNFNTPPKKKIIKYEFMCEQCGKRFKSNKEMECHQWIHTGQKLFECNDCGKSFSQKINLANHIEIAHLGVRFDCKTCGKSLSNQSNLGRHIKNHSDNRPWECKLCEKKFMYPSQVRLHVDFVHDKKPYPKYPRIRVGKKTSKNTEKKS